MKHLQIQQREGYSCLIALIFITLFISGLSFSQTTLNTTHINNNGASSVIFNIENTNTYDIVISEFRCFSPTIGMSTSNIIYRTTPFNDLAAPWDGGVVAAGQNGWNLVGNGNPNCSNSIVPILTNANLIIPAGATYQFGISMPSLSYMTLIQSAGVYTASANGVNILTGTGISWGGAAFPSTPVNYPRGLVGGISFDPASPCIAPPIAGTISSSVNPVCPSVNFNLNLTGGTGGSGQSYQWQFSFDNSTWTNISGATLTNFTTSQTVDTYYRCYTTCSSLSDTSASFLVSVSNFLNCYCTSTATSPNDTEILNVTVSDLNNTSTCGTTGGAGSNINLYSNYSSLQPPTLTLGGGYPMSVEVGTCGTTAFGSIVKAWIDFNQNGSFADPGEEILTTGTSINGAYIFTDTIQIPLNALQGITKMRVINVETTNANNVVPCGTYTWGETEDYEVNIASIQNASCITGQAFCDANNNQIFDSGETGVGLVPFTVQYGNNIQYHQADLFGAYSFIIGNQIGQSAVITLDQNWLSQHGAIYTNISDTLLLQSCSVGGPNTSSIGVDCSSFTGQVECVYGVVFCDANGNGLQDSLELGIPNAPIEMTSSTGVTTTIYTNSQGIYSYAGGTQYGASVTAEIPQAWLTQEGHSISNNSFSVSTDCYSQTPFFVPISCNPNPCLDLFSHLSMVGSYFQNTTKNIYFSFSNLTPLVQHPYTATLTVPTGVAINAVVNTGIPYVINGNSVVFSVPANFVGLASGNVSVTIPGGLANGVAHTYSIVATPPIGVSDCNWLNNQNSLVRIVGNSYDPNDKSSNKELLINPDVQDEFEYRIRFQNTGTAPAQDIYILDTLSANLDWNTLKMITTSHNMQLINHGNGQIKFNFPGIWLPDSSTNQVLSNGYLVYSIKEKASITVGSTIENTAHIFFDWNPAIVTNTTLNINAYLGLEDIQLNELSVYPNPFNATIRLTSAKQMTEIKVMDITGKEIYTTKADDYSKDLDLSSFAGGTYLIRVLSGTEVSTIRIVKR